MPQTTTADLIIPEVWADAVGPKILGRAVMAQFATVDDELAGQPGDSITFPKWNYIGDAVDLTEGVAMDTTTMTMVDSHATIKEAGKAVELTDSALLTALGSPDSQAQTQLAIAVARKIDTDLRIAAEITETQNDSQGVSHTYAPLKLAAPAARLNWSTLVGGFALLGDEYDPENVAVLVVHSAQYADLLLDPDFLSADKFGAGAVLQRGQIGAIGTIPVIMSNRVTKTGTGADTVYNALLILKGALALKYKRRPVVERDRDILKRTNIITTNVHYAVKRVDDRGVIVLPTKSVAVVGA
jgi:N4-gp56 family major capsid protein